MGGGGGVVFLGNVLGFHYICYICLYSMGVRAGVRSESPPPPPLPPPWLRACGVASIEQHNHHYSVMWLNGKIHHGNVDQS